MCAIALSCGIGSAASADPIGYFFLQDESNAFVSSSISAGLDVNPDFTELLPGGNDFPMFHTLTATSNTQPTNDSTLIADVGLPGEFNNGTSGITISNLSIVLPDLPGPLEGFGIVSVPLDVTGSNFQGLAAFVHVTSFRLDLNSPLTSSLTPTANPNEWLWAGLADVTLSGTIHPLIQIPTQGDIPGGQYPFSQQVTMPLVGTFSGDSTKTRVAVGIEQGALQNQNLTIPPISEQFNVGNLGLVTGVLNLGEFTLVDISTAAIYEVPVPIPEPNTALLLALGLVGIAWRRRQ